MIQLKAMWEPGSQVTARGTDPQRVADEIFSISDTPTADEIVSMASNPETESNKLFDWDDAVAGPKWRKFQAGNVLRCLKVQFLKDESELDVEPKKFTPCRLFYGNPTKEGGYMAITTIMGSKDLYQQLLERAKMEIKAYRKKYAMLKELDALFEVIDLIE
jgi:hypothetical protein